jgi:hypothetical protein
MLPSCAFLPVSRLVLALSTVTGICIVLLLFLCYLGNAPLSRAGWSLMRLPSKVELAAADAMQAVGQQRG